MTEDKSAKNTKQFVSFRIDDFLLGIDILKVREINLLPEITSVQYTPEYIRGLINLRGQIVTVLDLGVKLGRPMRPLTAQSHNIILKSDDVGILVDAIGEVIDVRPEEIDVPPANMDIHHVSYIDSVVKLESELMMIVDPDTLLKTLKKAVNAGEV